MRYRGRGPVQELEAVEVGHWSFARVFLRQKDKTGPLFWWFALAWQRFGVFGEGSLGTKWRFAVGVTKGIGTMDYGLLMGGSFVVADDAN